TGRIAICGFSAGAHNCAMYSVYWNTPLIYGHFNKKPEEFKPAATILGYTLSDYFLMKENAGEGIAKDLFEMSNLALTGCLEPDAATLDAVSPALHVTESTPPMFLWATAADELVPVENSLRMASALTRCKIPFEMHIFEEGMHGLSLSDQSTAASMDMINVDAAKWVPMAEAWLSKRLTFKLPEKMQWEF
ncbi:MAG: prolyl oligopeptidase family serine peptidase, partial [Clostridiales bacterium]|nr:prolyl oligopeptidase family serine peptidase [Clostridiales bacterium]